MSYVQSIYERLVGERLADPLADRPSPQPRHEQPGEQVEQPGEQHGLRGYTRVLPEAFER